MAYKTVTASARTVAILDELTTDENAALRSDVLNKGENLGTFDPATEPQPASVNINDYFYDSTQDNALYYATAADQLLGAFTLLPIAADPEATTPGQAVSTTGTDYTTSRTWSTEMADLWGSSRRVRRIFGDAGDFDYPSLGYADRTAVFIRNSDAVNGRKIIYGTGGTTTLEVTHANGTKQTIVGADEFSILQPNEFSVFEKDENLARLEIISGERISYFDDYADAAVKAATQVAYDGVAVIRSTGEFWARKTTTNSAAFPADGVPNADWFKVGGETTFRVFDALVDAAGQPMSHGESFHIGNGQGVWHRKSASIGDVVAFDSNNINDFTRADSMLKTKIFTASFSTSGENNLRHRYNGTAPSTLTISSDLYSEGDIKEIINTNVGELTIDLIAATNARFVTPEGLKETLTLQNGEALTLVRNAGPFWTMTGRLKQDATSIFDNAQPYVAGMDIPADAYVVYSGTDADNGLWQATSAVTNADADIRNEPLAFRGKVETQDRSTVAANGASIGMDVFDLNTGQTSLRWMVRDGESATFTKFSNPAIVEVTDVNGLASITDTGTTSRAILVTGPAIVEFQRNSTQFNFIVQGLAGGDGLRGKPVADIAALKALEAKDGETRRAGLDWYVFTLGATSGDEADDAATGFWVKDEAPTIATGNAVERDVIQANRGSTMSFGDLQFRVPSSGNSSLQMRYAAGVTTITDFTTKWSNQQGGASENAFGFNLGSAWAYFRANGSLNLTLHNSYQDATFVCNGWLYRVEVIVGSGWTNNRFSFSRWRLEGIKGDPGTNGVDGIDGTDAASVDHISLTAGDSSPGTTDTYTLWGDAGETVNLGTYDVPIPAAPSGITAVELGSYSGGFTTGQLIPLAGGRTWQDVLDEFQFVYVLVGGNNLYAHEQTAQFHVDDLVTTGRDMAITGYMTHGSNGYHMRLITPATTATQVSINNDNSSMQVQRIVIRGIK